MKKKRKKENGPNAEMADTTETCKVDLKAENWWTNKRTSTKGKWRW